MPESDRSHTLAIVGTPSAIASVYPAQSFDRLSGLRFGSPRIVPGDRLAEHAAELADVEIVLGTWGMPKLDEAALTALPKLRLVLYGAGSIAGFATDAMWARGLRVSTATHANSIPVAEYTSAAIFFALKRVLQHGRQTKEIRRFEHAALHGAYHATVGLISLGEIARLVVHRLESSDLRLLAYDPHLPESEAESFGVELDTLVGVFERSAVVSVHTPLLPETVGLITEDLIGRLPEGGGFINTSRGAVVDHDGLIKVAMRRPDLQFVLDVTDPEPPEPNSPLYELENVLITPHIAGSIGPECRRMGDVMIDELERELAGSPLRHELSLSSLDRTAHGPKPKEKST